MKVLVKPKLLKIISFGTAKAIALFPFILVSSEKDKNNITMINHEKIHLKQQTELLLFFFYFLYFVFFLLNYIKYGNFHKAYMNIPFEKESYQNEQDLKYLSNRKFLAWLKKQKKLSENF